MAISATQVKELRERTGAGMMECKRALESVDGDLDAAAEHLRKEGLAKADKKASRVAAEGAIFLAQDDQAAVMVEVNCETDFVAKEQDFGNFGREIASLTLDQRPADVEALGALPMAAGTVEERRRSLIATIGENIGIRRFVRIEAEGGVVAAYLHGSRIGSLVAVDIDDAELARDLAMHVAASAPAYLDADAVPTSVTDAEREIIAAQSDSAGKPPEIVAKMVEGRLRKFLAEITLVGQPFVKDPDTTVGKLLQQKSAKITGFARFEVGEGIEKEVDDFVGEVMAQAREAQRA